MHIFIEPKCKYIFITKMTFIKNDWVNAFVFKFRNYYVGIILVSIQQIKF